MRWWNDLASHAGNTYSQNGEDGVLARIFEGIEPESRFCVEFGAADGQRQSNTKCFRDQGWASLLLDAIPAHPIVKPALITADNINFLFKRYRVPRTFDLLSIDIDGNDYWVWKALKWHARVVVIECNPRWPQHVAKTIQYNPDHRFDRTNYYGASPLAMKKLGTEKGLKLVYFNGLNAIFVDHQELPKGYDCPLIYSAHSGWPQDKCRRPWIAV